MLITDLIKEKLFIEKDFESKKEILKHFAKILKENNYISNEKKVYKSILKNNTDFVINSSNNIGILPIMSKFVSEPIIAYANSSNMQWRTPSGKTGKLNSMFFILCNENDQDKYKEAIKQVSAFINTNKFNDSYNEIKSVDDIVKLVDQKQIDETSAILEKKQQEEELARQQELQKNNQKVENKKFEPKKPEELENKESKVPEPPKPPLSPKIPLPPKEGFGSEQKKVDGLPPTPPATATATASLDPTIKRTINKNNKTPKKWISYVENTPSSKTEQLVVENTSSTQSQPVSAPMVPFPGGFKSTANDVLVVNCSNNCFLSKELIEQKAKQLNLKIRFCDEKINHDDILNSKEVLISLSNELKDSYTKKMLIKLIKSIY